MMRMSSSQWPPRRGAWWHPPIVAAKPSTNLVCGFFSVSDLASAPVLCLLYLLPVCDCCWFQLISFISACGCMLLSLALCVVLLLCVSYLSFFPLCVLCVRVCTSMCLCVLVHLSVVSHFPTQIPELFSSRGAFSDLLCLYESPQVVHPPL